MMEGATGVKQDRRWWGEGEGGQEASQFLFWDGVVCQGRQVVWCWCYWRDCEVGAGYRARTLEFSSESWKGLMDLELWKWGCVWNSKLIWQRKWGRIDVVLVGWRSRLGQGYGPGMTWLGKVSCWVKWKLSSKLMNSDANLQVSESHCVTKLFYIVTTVIYLNS